MDAVRLGPLQYRNVLKPVGHARPVSHRAFVHQMGDVVHLAEDFCAACPVVQINRHEGDAVQVIRDTVGDAHHIPVGQARLARCHTAAKPTKPGGTVKAGFLVAPCTLAYVLGMFTARRFSALRYPDLRGTDGDQGRTAA